MGAGRIVSIADVVDVADGDEVAILAVDEARIPLGDGVREPSVYPAVEALLGRPLAEDALA